MTRNIIFFFFSYLYFLRKKMNRYLTFMCENSFNLNGIKKDLYTKETNKKMSILFYYLTFTYCFYLHI